MRLEKAIRTQSPKSICQPWIDGIVLDLFNELGNYNDAESDWNKKRLADVGDEYSVGCANGCTTSRATSA